MSERCRDHTKRKEFLLTNNVNLSGSVNDKVEFTRGTGSHAGTGLHVHPDDEEVIHPADEDEQVWLPGLADGKGGDIFA